MNGQNEELQPSGPDQNSFSERDLQNEEVRWLNLVSRIRKADPDAAEEWIALQSRVVGLLLRRRLGSAASAETGRTLLTEAISEIRAGRIQNPRQFLDWLGRAALRYASDNAELAVASDCRPTVEQISRLKEALRRREPRSREAMRRFYLEGEPAERVASDLGYSRDEFLQLRSKLRLEVVAGRLRKPAESAGEGLRRTAGAG